MRKIIKKIIEATNIYNEAMWGEGGYYDSLAGEKIGFKSKEIEEKANNALSDLKSIYSNKNGIPTTQTLLNNGLNKDCLEIIENVKKSILEKK